MICPATWNSVEVEIDTTNPWIPEITTTSTAQMVNGRVVLDVQTSVHLTSQFVHAAIFDSENRQIDHIVVPVTRPLRNFYVVFNEIPNASYARVFIWDSPEIMEPLSDAEKVPIM